MFLVTYFLIFLLRLNISWIILLIYLLFLFEPYEYKKKDNLFNIDSDKMNFLIYNSFSLFNDVIIN
jgi:hypothetical protein